MNATLVATDAGLYCPAGGFHVDPWAPVDRALITHAHADHARPGSRAYLAAAPGAPLLRARLPTDATIETVRYGEVRRIGDVDVSFHPAGHVLGSAQIRIAWRGRVLVVAGDYKLATDPTCDPFEPVACETFVTESTFGLPIYRWEPPATTMLGIRNWWARNRDDGFASVVFAYALGKSQRIAAGLAAVGDLPGPIACHGAVARISDAYRDAGVCLPPMSRVSDAPSGTGWRGALVLAPPSAQGSTWLARLAPCRTAVASGWMTIRGARRRAGVDRGFVLSDHADWPALNRAVAASGAAEVIVTHGYRDEFVRWLRETRPGASASGLATRFERERGAAPTQAATPDGPG